MDKIPKVYDEQNWIYSAFPTAGQKAPLRLSEVKKSPLGLGLISFVLPSCVFSSSKNFLVSSATFLYSVF